MPKNSDDLVFSHRPGFSDFFQILHIFAVLNVVYDPFFTTKTTISKKNSLTTPFFYSVRTLMRITSQNIGGTDAWAVPHLKFWGDRPPGLRPCVQYMLSVMRK